MRKDSCPEYIFLNKGISKSGVLYKKKKKDMQIVVEHVKNEQLSHQRSIC